MLKQRKRKRPRPVATGESEPMAEPAATSSSAGKPSARRRTNLKVNGWILYRGTTPVATGATQREAVEEASRYLCDPAAGLMHLRPAIGNELPPHEAIGSDHPLAAAREVVVRGIERLVQAAEQAGDVHAADVLKDAAARLRQASDSG